MKAPTEREMLALFAAARSAAPQPPPPPWASTRQIAEALGVGRDAARRRVELLRKQGRIETQEFGGRHYYKLKNGKR